jgi:formamidopyrimidine-DNA glycosylase
MPEGPEIRYIVEKIKPEIIKKSVVRVTALSKRKVRIPERGKIVDVWSKGKLLVLETKKFYIHIHFGITGWLDFEEGDYTKYIIHFGITEKSLKLYLDSMRKFSKITVVKPKSHEKKIDKLGIDILTKEFTIEQFMYKLMYSRQTVSSFLLDQSIFCGVGNYIRNEALYLSKIHPEAKTDQLESKQIKLLFKNIKYVSFSMLLTWFKLDKIKVPNDIKQLAPNRVRVPYVYRVYGKDRDLKGNKVTLTTVAGRKTYYVKSLQKK